MITLNNSNIDLKSKSKTINTTKLNENVNNIILPILQAREKANSNEKLINPVIKESNKSLTTKNKKIENEPSSYICRIRPSLIKLYKEDNEDILKLKQFKKNKRTKTELTLEKYQEKLYNMVKHTLSKDSLKLLNEKFRSVINLSHSVHDKIKITKWREIAKKIEFLVPDYLIEKFRMIN